MSTLKTLVSTGVTPRPPRVILYAVEGIGKSSFGASAYNPIFIPTEEGLDEISAPKFPKAQSFDDVMGYLRLLYTEKHDYKTVVIDTIDWLEPLIWEKTCALHGEPNIEGMEKKSKFGFAKGYHYALDQWLELLKALDCLRNERDMAVILIGHAEVKRFDSPDTEPYDRYQIKLHKLATAKLVEWANAVLFVNYQIFTEKTDVGFNKKVVRGTGGQNRVMYTEERPAFKAKNQYGLPPEFPFVKNEAWNTLITAIKSSRITTNEKGEQDNG